ncbi:restriction endonuclease subunit S [Vibrio europaeus]|uniref:restriction endonuclease subunit S n=1 Tax=Vibrio europaeus TaxID=300876 RepID=UPI00233F6C4A|nr:restriction endonuclease subunit S [Vibrio europaeus]MDC5718208.1 restriction endonuclease subunit S [Vibrio europaeus]MDC5753694.1 restriction endonuclease subunit S [Vibrio europaeus]MDC5778393.1 restriction endonuclease subunit S [Vibrio europaeus]MDC5793568.1 restriction endonuclease subunit S [Vibrio europaeus]MDC5798874.1 restriction endonuclease subunit S [Vibrio europaeus]
MTILTKVKIQDLGKVFTGSTPPTKDETMWGGEYLFVKPSDLVKGSRRVNSTENMLTEVATKTAKGRLLPAGTTCVVTIGTIGKLCQLHKPAATNQQINSIVVDRDKYDEDYIYYLMSQSIDKIRVVEGGSASGREHVKKSTFEQIELEVLPLENQRKVSKLVAQYDNLIEINNRRIDILEDMAQSLYREWFVNFLYPGNVQNEPPLESSGKGWSSKPLGELVDFKRNTIKKGSVPPKTPYMGLEHFPRKSIALENWDEVDEIGSNKLAFERGDILFGKIRPNFHKVGVAQVDGLCSSDTFVLSPVDSEHHALISMVTFSDEFVAQAVQTSQGSKMPRASWDVLKEFPVCIPPQDILDKFNAVVTPAIEQVRVLSLKNRNLKKQRDMLLPKLISGEIEL